MINCHITRLLSAISVEVSQKKLFRWPTQIPADKYTVKHSGEKNVIKKITIINWEYILS